MDVTLANDIQHGTFPANSVKSVGNYNDTYRPICVAIEASAEIIDKMDLKRGKYLREKRLCLRQSNIENQ